MKKIAPKDIKAALSAGKHIWIKGCIFFEDKQTEKIMCMFDPKDSLGILFVEEPIYSEKMNSWLFSETLHQAWEI